MRRITKKEPYFDYYRLLCAFVSPPREAGRFVGMGCIKSEHDGHLVACNGRALVIWKPQERIHSGYYEIIKNTTSEVVLVHKDTEGNYPNYQDVLDRAANTKGRLHCVINHPHGGPKNTAYTFDAHVNAILSHHAKLIIRIGYLLPVGNIPEKFDMYFSRPIANEKDKTELGPVCFYRDDLTIAIMPILADVGEVEVME